MSADPKSCKVCLVPHDEEIHLATLSVRNWFRDQVTQGFYEDFEEQQIPLLTLEECQVA